MAINLKPIVNPNNWIQAHNGEWIYCDGGYSKGLNNMQRWEFDAAAKKHNPPPEVIGEFKRIEDYKKALERLQLKAANIPMPAFAKPDFSRKDDIWTTREGRQIKIS